MLLYQKANSAHYKQKPRKKIHMRIMTSECEGSSKTSIINLLSPSLELFRV